MEEKKVSLLLVGHAGAGKDTVADALAFAFPGRVGKIAQSDPLKWLARDVFRFSSDQLWGPSENRNKVDSRWDLSSYWHDCTFALRFIYGRRWLEDLMPGQLVDDAFDQLVLWLDREAEFAFKHRTLTPRRILQTLGTEFGRKHLGPLRWAEFASQRVATAPQPCTVITDGRFHNEAVFHKDKGAWTFRVEGPSRQDAEEMKHASEAEVDNVACDFVIQNVSEFGHATKSSLVSQVVESLRKVGVTL